MHINPLNTDTIPPKKTKILYLKDILLEETDDQHGLTMPQLIEKLEEKGIGAERKAIYHDLDILKNYGLDIIKRGAGRSLEYAIGERYFELPELLLLTDAVQSSRFLTDKKSKTLIKKLKDLASRPQRKLLDKHMHVENRIKMQNESVYYNIDTIQDAIRQKKQISFQYFMYGVSKQEVFRRNGQFYQESPVELVYTNDCYYLVSYNSKHDDFVVYRVDRMLNIQALDELIPSNKKINAFDAQEFSARAFGMFSGEPCEAEILAEASIIPAIIDRFGKDVLMYLQDEDHATIHVKILKSDVFFGWVAQFGDKVRLTKPASLAEEYQAYLQSILDCYQTPTKAPYKKREMP